MLSDDHSKAVLIGRMTILRDATYATLGLLSETRLTPDPGQESVELFARRILDWLEAETAIAMSDLQSDADLALKH